jgi:signal transduction histidine kinase
MRISNLIFFSIFLILLLFSITTYVNYKQSEKVRENAQFLSTSSNIVRLSNQFQRNILYMERGLRGYLVTGEEYLLQTYNSGLAENTSLLNELSPAIPANSVQFEKLNKIKGLYNEWINGFADTVIATSKKDALSENTRKLQLQSLLKDEEQINKSLQQSFKELLNVEYANRDKRRLQLEQSEQQTKFISALLTALSIVVGFVIAILLAHHISRRILKMVKMANTIANGNYKVHVKDSSNDELSELTRSLNHMALMLEQSISLLKRKNEELDQFAHIVSHDLKAPLRGMDNVLAWIEEDHAHELPVKVNEYLRLIKGRINRSENFIQGILTYARIGKEPHASEQVNIKSLVDEVVENLSMKPGINVSIQNDMPVIRSEKVPLTQVFTNLISNAVKYHNKPHGEIKIYYKEEKDYYKFFVEDNGPGIDKAYHNKIFVIFQTLTERDSFESTGVGLAIVKKILDDRNETINVTSEPGKGSIFSFTWKKQL